VLGISVDSVYSHQAFATELGGLDFPLLADFHPKGQMTKAYGLWREDRGYSRRAIIILDGDATVRHSQVIERGAPEVEAVLAAVRAIAGKDVEQTKDDPPRS
jgi:peroxiredoxin